MKNDQKKNKVGRRRDGEEVKNVCSIRMEDKTKKLIIDKFGSLQKWIDKKINEVK